MMFPVKSFTFAVAILLMFCSFGFAAAPGVREIPLPADAADVTYVRSRGDIRLKVSADMKTAGSFYATTLAEQQWTKAKKDNLQRNFWVQSFAKPGLTLEVRVDQRAAGCEIRLTPQGFAWDEDLAPRPEDLPIPDDAKKLEFEDFFERIEFESASSRQELAKFYAGKLDAKTWSSTGADIVTPDVVQLKRTSGKASVTILVRKDGASSQVTITTKGMAWDGVKTANAAKKAMNKVADANTPEVKPAPESPKRADKPAKGIDRLEKLASRCVLTVDGEPIDLAHIVAYECVSQGEWRTKVVAAASEINQRPLLERLKATNSDEGWTLKSPYLKFELDQQDRPVSMSLFAEQLAGGGSRDELEGESLVEAGRARGTVKLKTKTFFKKAYAAELTFDVPLLTRDSAPVKRLADAPVLPSAGKLTIGGRTRALAHVTVYETTQFDKVVTAVLLTERPINLAKLKASLNGPDRNDDRFNEFQPQIKLVIDADEQLSGISIWCDNLSISGTAGDNIRASVAIEDGRARGTVKTLEPDEAFDKKYEFDLSFDAAVLTLPAAK
ncbi:MAG: hypothetical protein QM775_05720 [Pirellulales bacterium]